MRCCRVLSMALALAALASCTRLTHFRSFASKGVFLAKNLLIIMLNLAMNGDDVPVSTAALRYSLSFFPVARRLNVDLGFRCIPGDGVIRRWIEHDEYAQRKC